MSYDCFITLHATAVAIANFLVWILYPPASWSPQKSPSYDLLEVSVINIRGY
jgi:hypothetical protein